VTLHFREAEIANVLSIIRSLPRAPRTSDAVRKFDFRRSKSTDSERFTAAREILQRFAADFGAWTVDYLRTDGQIKLLSVEQTIFADFTNAISKTAHLAAFQLMPADLPFLFQADWSVVYPIIDLILGGPGTTIEELRPLTLIEEQVFETVSQFICADLKKVCSQLSSAEVRSAGRCSPAQVKSILPDRETILAANFEVRVGATQGLMQLAFPSAGFDVLTQPAMKPRPAKRVSSAEDRERLKRSLLDSKFKSQLVLPPAPVKVRELLSLEPGKVLVLPRRAADPANLQVVGKATFAAYPVRRGQQRGAQIDKRISAVREERNPHE